jgi:tight adherence protein B
MNGVTLGLTSCAMLLIGVALFLWQGANARTQRLTTSAFIGRQLDRVAALANAPAGALVLEKRPRFELPRLKSMLLRAGVVSNRRFAILLTVPWLVLVVVAWVLAGTLAASVMFLMVGVLAYFRLWLRIDKRSQAMGRQLPGFLDSIVRLLTIGNSLPSAFQELAPITEAPLGEVLVRASQLSQAGVDLDVALRQMARLYGIEELYLVAAVIGVATRFGGRVDTVLERMALFMRDIHQARQELFALSAETRLSAWILALLPICVGGFMLMFNGALFINMWHDPLGRKMLSGAVLLQLIGSYWLYRLAKAI